MAAISKAPVGFGMKFRNLVQCHRHPEESPIDDQHSGDVLCPICGLVLDKVIDCSAEWRSFDTDQVEKSRVGGAENVHLSSAANLVTKILRPIGPLNRFGHSIAQRYKQRSVDNALIAAFRIIAEVAARMHLPESVTERAYHLYGDVYRKRQLKGNIMFHDPKTVASLYIACRIEECSRTAAEICGASEYNTKEVVDVSKNIMRQLHIKLKRSNSSDYVSRFCYRLDVPEAKKRLATKITNAMDSIKKDHLPECMAAAAICEANENLVVDHVSKILQLNTESIEGCQRRIRETVYSTSA